MPTDSSQRFPFSETGPGGDGDAQSSAAGAAQTAQVKAQQAAGQAQEKAQQAAGQAQDKLREQIDQRSVQVAEQINTQASDLRSVSEALREEGKDGPADAADRLAEYAEKVGGYLHDKDSHALLADAEDFGRQRPWAVAAGGLAIGLAASRFLKASSSRRYQSRSSRSGSGSGSAPTLANPAPFARDENPLELNYAGTTGYSAPPVYDDQSGSGSAA